MLRNVSSAPPTRLAFALSRKRLADPHKGRAIAYGISNTWAQLAEKFSNRNRLRTAIFESGEAGRRNNGIELLASSIRFFICDSPALVGRAIAYGISNTWAQLAEKFSNRNRLRTAIFESGEAGRRNNGIELLASSIRFFICDSPAPQGGKVSNSAALLRCL